MTRPFDLLNFSI